jgi:hypothetical protein
MKRTYKLLAALLLAAFVSTAYAVTCYSDSDEAACAWTGMTRSISVGCTATVDGHVMYTYTTVGTYTGFDIVPGDYALSVSTTVHGDFFNTIHGSGCNGNVFFHFVNCYGQGQDTPAPVNVPYTAVDFNTLCHQ